MSGEMMARRFVATGPGAYYLLTKAPTFYFRGDPFPFQPSQAWDPQRLYMVDGEVVEVDPPYSLRVVTQVRPTKTMQRAFRKHERERRKRGLELQKILDKQHEELRQFEAEFVGPPEPDPRRELLSFGLSVRSRGALQAYELLSKKKIADAFASGLISRIPNLGKVSITEIIDKVFGGIDPRPSYCRTCQKSSARSLLLT